MANRDFEALQRSSYGMEEQLRKDENVSDDLYDRIQRKSYTVRIEPYKSEFKRLAPLSEASESDFKSFVVKEAKINKKGIKFPPELLQKINDPSHQSLMGILPEINRVWVSTGNILYFWNYTDPSARYEEVVSMGGAGAGAGAGNDDQPDAKAAKGNDGAKVKVSADSDSWIVSVALTAPKPGVFTSNIKYVLVIATAMYVGLLAVSSAPGGAGAGAGGAGGPSAAVNIGTDRGLPRRSADLQNDEFQKIFCYETPFKMYTDNILCRKVLGSQSGRVFMCGGDSNVYEMEYDNVDSTWNVLSNNLTPKAFKVTRTAWLSLNPYTWRVSGLLPPNLRGALGYSDHMVDMAIDDVRNLVYAVDSSGNVSVLYLGEQGNESISAVRSFNVFENCRSVRSGPSPATNGVLEAIEKRTQEPVLTIVSVHVIGISESTKCHAVVVLSNGIRIYLTLRNADGGIFLEPKGIPRNDRHVCKATPTLSDLPKQKAFALIPDMFSSAAPSSIEIFAAIAPPSANHVTDFLDTNQHMNGQTISATKVSTGIQSQNLQIHGSYYAQGVFMLAAERPKNYAGGGQHIISLCDDTWHNRGRQFCESLSVNATVKDEATSANAGLKDRTVIWDIRQNTSALQYTTASQILSLVHQSFTPAHLDYLDKRDAVTGILGPYPGVSVGSFDGDMYLSEVPALPCPALAPQGRGASLGIARNALFQSQIQAELSMQHCPVPNFSLQRQFFVLESKCLHVLQKYRPVDFLFDAINKYAESPGELKPILKNIADAYGEVEYCAMCVGLACGLPCDAGGNSDISAAKILAPTVASTSNYFAMKWIDLGSLSKKPDPGWAPSYKGAANPADSECGPEKVNLSFKFQGFELFFSRIVRPLWLRPLTEIFRPESLTLSQKEFCLPAQYVSRQVLRSIYIPLEKLKTLMFDKTAHGYGSTIISYYLIGDSNTAGQPTSNETASAAGIRLATDCENKRICELFSLIKRTVHALRLLETLLIAYQDWKLPVSWDVFRGVNLRNLVINARTHVEVKTALRGLILKVTTDHDAYQKQNVLLSAATPGSVAAYASGRVQINGDFVPKLTEMLKTNSYMYYSDGDEKWHIAENKLKALEKVLGASLTTITPQVKAQAHEAVQSLIAAAEHWNSTDLVKSLLNGTSTQLKDKCDQLMGLGRLGQYGVSELCLAAAKNFLDSKPASSVYSYASANAEPDRHLYHGGSILSKLSLAANRQAIYSTLLDSILSVGLLSLSAGASAPASSDKTVIQLEMINDALRHADSSPTLQVEFVEVLCLRLMKEEPDLLLRVSDVNVGKALERLDSKLREKWLTMHGFYELNAKATFQQAIQNQPSKAGGGGSSSHTNIADRIKIFRKAWQSAKMANTVSQYDYQTALEIAEAWQVGLKSVRPMFVRSTYDDTTDRFENQTHPWAIYIKRNLVPFYEGLAANKDRELDRFEREFIAYDLSPGSDILHAAKESQIARDFLANLKSWGKWSEYLLLKKAMQSKPEDFEIQHIWRCLIFRTFLDCQNCIYELLDAERLTVRSPNLMPANHSRRLSPRGPAAEPLAAAFSREFHSFTRNSLSPQDNSLYAPRCLSELYLRDGNQHFDNPGSGIGWANLLELEVVNVAKLLLFSSATQPIAGDSGSYVPVNLILSELEMLCVVVNNIYPTALREDWALKCLESIGLSPEKIMDAYKTVLLKTRTPSNNRMLDRLQDEVIYPFSSPPFGDSGISADIDRKYASQLLKSSFTALGKWFQLASKTSQDTARSALRDYTKKQMNGSSHFDEFIGTATGVNAQLTPDQRARFQGDFDRITKSLEEFEAANAWRW